MKLPANRTPQKNFVRNKISRGGFGNLKIIDLAREEFAKLKLERLQDNPPKDIWDLFDRLNVLFPGEYERPYHLKPYIDLLEESLKKDVYATVHAPSQIGKSQSCLVALVYYCLVNKATANPVIDPKTGKKKYSDYAPDNHLYLTSTFSLADKQKNKFVGLLQALGADFRTRGDTIYIRNLANQRTEHSVSFRSILAGHHGLNINGIVAVDDYMTAPDHETTNAMEKIWDCFCSGIISRRPPGAKRYSILIIATRKNARDLSGRVIEEYDWPYIRIPALCDDEQNDPLGRKFGETIWDKRSVESFEIQKAQVGERRWELLWQGNDFLDKNSKMFNDPSYYEKDFDSGSYYYSYGCDLAYSEKKLRSNDWSIFVRLKTCRITGDTHLDGLFRFQGPYEKCLESAKTFLNEKPGPCRMYGAGQEKAFVPQAFQRIIGKPLDWFWAGENKRIRAVNSNVAVAWNEGWLTLPLDDKSDDLKQFILEILNFDGNKNNGYHDDSLDALSAAYEIVKNIKLKILAGNNHMRPKMSPQEIQRVKKEIADMGGRYYKARD